MKLTEQQLAQLFKQAKTAEIKSSVDCLNNFSQASDARVAAVEKIADNSHLSASYQVINQLQQWSKSVASDMTNMRQQPVLEGFFAWFRPAIATVALASIVYISYPQFNSSSVDSVNSVEKGVFTASFEEAPISLQSQLPAKTTNEPQSDLIYSGGFG